MESIHVLVDNIPSNNLSIILTFISGIVLPIVVLIVSLRYTNLRRAEDDLGSKIARAYSVMDQLFLYVIKIAFNNYKKALIDKETEQIIETNKKVLESSNDLAIALSTWNISRQQDYSRERGKEFEILRMEIDSVRAVLKRLIREDVLKDLETALEAMLDNSNVAGSITDQKKNKVIDEMNKLGDILETNPRNSII